MASKDKPSWFHKAENCWLLASVALGVVNLLLIGLLWNVSGQIKNTDSLSVSLTILEIFLAVIAVSGFFLIRSAAMGKAEEEATEVADRVTKKEVAAIAPPLVRRAVEDYLSHLSEKSATIDTTLGVNELMQALDEGGDDE
jgi:type VI protein secretion system component VasK